MHIVHHSPHDGCPTCKRAEELAFAQVYLKAHPEELKNLSAMHKVQRANGTLAQWVIDFIKKNPDDWVPALEIMAVLGEVRNGPFS